MEEDKKTLLAKKKRLHGIIAFIATLFHQLSIGPLFIISEMHPYFISYLQKFNKSITISSGFLLYPVYNTSYYGSIFLGGFLEVLLTPTKSVVLSLFLALISGIGLYFCQNVAFLYFLFFLLGLSNGMASMVTVKNVILFFPEKKGIVAALFTSLYMLSEVLFSYLSEKVIINPKSDPADLTTGLYTIETAERVINYVVIAVISSTIFIVVYVMMNIQYDETEYACDEDAIDKQEEEEDLDNEKNQKDNDNDRNYIYRPSQFSTIDKKLIADPRRITTIKENQGFRLTEIQTPEKSDRYSVVVKLVQVKRTKEEIQERMSMAVFENLNLRAFDTINKKKDEDQSQSQKDEEKPLVEKINREEYENVEGYLTAALRSWRFWKIFINCFLSGFVITLGAVLYKPIGTAYGFQESDLQTIVIGKVLVCALATPIGGYLSDKCPFKVVLLIFTVGSCVFGVLIIFATNIWVYFLAIYLCYFCSGFMQSLPQHIMVVFGMKYFIQIFGIYCFSVVSSFLASSLTAYIFTSLDSSNLKDIFKICFGIGAVLSVVSIILSFFENDDPYIPPNFLANNPNNEKEEKDEKDEKEEKKESDNTNINVKED